MIPGRSFLLDSLNEIRAAIFALRAVDRKLLPAQLRERLTTLVEAEVCVQTEIERLDRRLIPLNRVELDFEAEEHAENLAVFRSARARTEEYIREHVETSECEIRKTKQTLVSHKIDSLGERNRGESSFKLCTACGHAEAFHRPNDGPCFGELDRNALSRSEIPIENVQLRKEMGAECWCWRFENDLFSGIASILTHGNPVALVAATKAAVERGDARAAQLLLDRYVLKTIEDGRDHDWTGAAERSIVRLQSEAAPEKRVGSLGDRSIPARDGSSQGIGGGAMAYPKEFSSTARARVEAERLKSTKELEQNRNQVPWSKYGPTTEDRENLRKYILRIFLSFAHQACELGLQGFWTVDRIRAEAMEFLRLLTIEAHYEQGYDKAGRKLGETICHLDGSILPEIEREFRKSSAWHQFEEELLAVAESQTREKAAPTGTQGIGSAYTRSTKRSKALDRRAAVDAYIDEVFQKAGKRITRTHIWKEARYRSRTEFERWERNDPKRPNKAADERFKRILTEKPHLN